MIGWVLNTPTSTTWIVIELFDNFIQSMAWWYGDGIASVNKQRYILIWFYVMYLFFVHSYVASNTEAREKMEEKVPMMLKPLQNCEETTAFVKKRFIIWHINKDCYLKNPNSPTGLQQVKLAKVLERYPKLEVVINFK